MAREEYVARQANYFTANARPREKTAVIKARGNGGLEPLENVLRMTKQAGNTAVTAEIRAEMEPNLRWSDLLDSQRNYLAQ